MTFTASTGHCATSLPTRFSCVPAAHCNVGYAGSSMSASVWVVVCHRNSRSATLLSPMPCLFCSATAWASICSPTLSLVRALCHTTNIIFHRCLLLVSYAGFSAGRQPGELTLRTCCCLLLALQPNQHPTRSTRPGVQVSPASWLVAVLTQRSFLPGPPTSPAARFSLWCLLCGLCGCESMHHVMQLSCPVHGLCCSVHLLSGMYALSACSHDSLPAWSAWVSTCSVQRSATNTAFAPIPATHHHAARSTRSLHHVHVRRSFALLAGCETSVGVPNTSVCSVGARVIRFLALACGMLANHLHAVSLSEVPVGVPAVSQVARVRVRVLSRMSRLLHPNTSATPPPTQNHFTVSLPFEHKSLFSRHMIGQ